MLRLLRSPREGQVGDPAFDRVEGRVEGRPDDPLRALAEAAGRGDREAQRTLLVAIGPSLLRIVRGVLGNAHPDVEDTLQEAMMAVHLALAGFRGECTTLHFACRVAVQTSMNARRKAGYRSRHTPSMPPADLVDLARDDRSPPQLIEAARRREALRQLLCELPEVQAEVLALHTLLGYTVEETAAATQVPVNTVRSRLRNALARLRERVQGHATLRDPREVES
jgi:RNA polymerase sigma-70 factor (ECF subfamily)